MKRSMVNFCVIFLVPKLLKRKLKHGINTRFTTKKCREKTYLKHTVAIHFSQLSSCA